MTTMYAMQCAPTSMFQILATSLNDAKGCAFLLAKDKLVTCSHVIDTALGSKNVQVGALVNCRWVNDKTEGSCRCKVIKYYPQKYETEPSCADICILQIESWEGQAALTAHPTSTDYQVGADLGMYCENPQSKGYGRHLSGRGNGSVQAGRVQIDLLQNGRESHAGFSGCPVFDLTAGKCVGMFVAQLSDGRSTSYMIAMASINTVWRELGQETGQDNGKPIVPWWQAQIARQLSFDVAARFAAALIEKSEQTDLDSTLAWFQAQLHSQEVTPLWKLNMVLESVICGDLDAGPCNKIKDWTLLIAGAFAAATIAPQGQASGTCVHQVPSEKKLLAQTYGAGLAKVPANWATPPEFDLECGARPDEFVDDLERSIAVLVQVVPQSIGCGKISQTEREYLRRKLQALADPKRSHSPSCVAIFIHHQTYAHHAMADQAVQQQLAARLADDNGRPLVRAIVWGMDEPAQCQPLFLVNQYDLIVVIEALLTSIKKVEQYGSRAQL